MEEQPKRVIGKPFPAGNPGRPVGSRNKLATDFVDALYADFQTHGPKAVADTREKDPAAYVRVIASILPKEIEIRRPLADLSDDELVNAVDLIRLAIARDTAGDASGIAQTGIGKSASELQAVSKTARLPH